MGSGHVAIGQGRHHVGHDQHQLYGSRLYQLGIFFLLPAYFIQNNISSKHSDVSDPKTNNYFFQQRPKKSRPCKKVAHHLEEIEETSGHYFDMVIIYSDPELAYQQRLASIQSLEREPQWVPAMWLLGKADTM